MFKRRPKTSLFVYNNHLWPHYVACVVFRLWYMGVRIRSLPPFIANSHRYTARKFFWQWPIKHIYYQLRRISPHVTRLPNLWRAFDKNCYGCPFFTSVFSIALLDATSVGPLCLLGIRGPTSRIELQWGCTRLFPGSDKWGFFFKIRFSANTR